MPHIKQVITTLKIGYMKVFLHFGVDFTSEISNYYRLGSMTGEEFLKQVLEPSTKKVGTEVPYGMMSTLRRYMNHDPHTAPQPHQGNKGNTDKSLFCISLYQLFL